MQPYFTPGNRLQVWYLNYTLDPPRKSSKRFHRIKTRHGMAEAIRQRDKFIKGEVGTGMAIEAGRLTLPEVRAGSFVDQDIFVALDEFLKHRVKHATWAGRKVSGDTTRWSRPTFVQHLGMGGIKRTKHVTKANILKMWRKRVLTTNLKHDTGLLVTKGTFKSYWSAMNIFFDWLLSQDPPRVMSNPMNDFKPRMFSEQLRHNTYDHLKRILEIAELEMFFNVPAGRKKKSGFGDLAIRRLLYRFQVRTMARESESLRIERQWYRTHRLSRYVLIPWVDDDGNVVSKAGHGAIPIVDPILIKGLDERCELLGDRGLIFPFQPNSVTFKGEIIRSGVLWVDDFSEFDTRPAYANKRSLRVSGRALLTRAGVEEIDADLLMRHESKANSDLGQGPEYAHDLSKFMRSLDAVAKGQERYDRELANNPSWKRQVGEVAS